MKKLRNWSFLLLVMISTTSFAQHLARNTFELSAGLGRRGILNEQEGVLRSTLSVGYNIRLNSLIDFKIATDALYFDQTQHDLLRAWSKEKWAYGAVIGSDLKLNRIIFTNGIGRYLYLNSGWIDKHPGDIIRFYTKIGFRYLITKNLTAGFVMRAHSVQADYIDFGLSVKF